MRAMLVLASLAAYMMSAAPAQVTNSPSTVTTAARAPKRQATTLTMLSKKIGDVSFTEQPFDQVVDWLRDQTGMNVVVRWQTLEDAGVEREKPISLQVKNLTLAQILWMIMSDAGGTDLKLAYRASGNVLVLSTEEDLGKEMLVRVYNVEDLLVRVPRFTGPHIDLQQQQGGAQGGGTSVFGGSGGGSGGNNDDDEGGGGGAGGGAGEAGANDPEMERLVTLITQTVHPDSWVANGGAGTIQAFRRQLVVRNNIRVHQDLGGSVTDSAE